MNAYMYICARQPGADLLLQKTPPEVKEESGAKSSRTSSRREWCCGKCEATITQITFMLVFLKSTQKVRVEKTYMS